MKDLPLTLHALHKTHSRARARTHAHTLADADADDAVNLGVHVTGISPKKRNTEDDVQGGKSGDSDGFLGHVELLRPARHHRARTLGAHW